MAQVGFIVVFNRIPALMVAVEANSRAAPKRVADRIAATARSLAAVDTGEMRSKIISVSIATGKEAEVQANAAHSGFVEYGTYKMAAQPFLAPAVAAHEHEFAIEVAKPLAGAF